MTKIVLSPHLFLGWSFQKAFFKDWHDMFFVLCFPCFWIFRWHQRPFSFLCCFLSGGRGKIRKDRAVLAFAIWSYSLRSVWLDFHEWVATYVYTIIPFSSPSLAQRLLRWLQVCAGPVPLTDPRWESDFWCPPCPCGGAEGVWLPAQAWFSLGMCSVVCLGERADPCAQQQKTCDCWVWSEDKIF